MTMSDLINMYILEHGKIDLDAMSNVVATYEAVSSISKTNLNKFKKALHDYQYTEFARIDDTAASQKISRTSPVILNEKNKVETKVKNATELAEKIYNELTSSSPSSGLSYADNDSVITRFADILKKSKLSDSDIQSLNKVWGTLNKDSSTDKITNKLKNLMGTTKADIKAQLKIKTANTPLKAADVKRLRSRCKAYFDAKIASVKAQCQEKGLGANCEIFTDYKKTTDAAKDEVDSIIQEIVGAYEKLNPIDAKVFQKLTVATSEIDVGDIDNIKKVATGLKIQTAAIKAFDASSKTIKNGITLASNAAKKGIGNLASKVSAAMGRITNTKESVFNEIVADYIVENGSIDDETYNAIRDLCDSL